MKNLKKGFTIIEMVIVIAIIGILASVLIPTYGNVVNSANESAALQTARSTMTNWLASSTSSAGVPTSGNDQNGNPFYAAYFEYSNNDNGKVYQYRYTSGGVERTDTNPSYYVNFSKGDQKMTGLAPRGLPKYISDLYLTTPEKDASFDVNTYKVSVYEQKIGDGDKVSTNYYTRYPADGAYSCGGADVFAAVSDTTIVYKLEGSNYQPYFLGKADEKAAAAAGIAVTPTVITGWVETPNNPGTTATTYTITAKANSAAGISTDQALTTGTDGKLTSLPALNSGSGWYDAESGGNEVTTATIFTSNVNIYAHSTSTT